MKKKNYYNLFYPIGILILIIFTSFSIREIEKSNPIKNILEKMHFVEGGTRTFGYNKFSTITKYDSTLLSCNALNRQEVNSFYISATEVTNIEWWEFYMAMKEELGTEKAVELYYPDTLVWINEFESDNRPMMRNYFQNQKYDDYPVIGVSWVQAQEYCRWKTQMLRSAAKGRNDLKEITFRLPTQNEWELAAHGLIDLDNDKYIYPWPGIFYKKDGKHLANFGNIDDVNGVRIKNYPDDGALYTSTVGNYPPNSLGLYDMAGNVAEWVSDTAKIYDVKKKKIVYKQEDIDAMIKFYENEKILDGEVSDGLYDEHIKKIILDKEILSSGDMRLGYCTNITQFARRCLANYHGLIMLS